jgi:hypothetical protein
MRALVLDAINNWSNGVDRGFAGEEGLNELALDMSEMLEPIAVLETQLEVCSRKLGACLGEVGNNSLSVRLLWFYRS